MPKRLPSTNYDMLHLKEETDDDGISQVLTDEDFSVEELKVL